MRAPIGFIALFSSFLCLACSPGLNPQLKSSLDTKIGAIARSASTNYEAPQASEAMQLTVGQWSRYKRIDTEGKPSLITYKIVGEQGDAHWVESVTESYFSRQVMLMLIVLGDRQDPSTMAVKAVKQKVGNDPATELPPAMLSLMQALWRPILQGMVVQWQDKPQQDITVNAGHFAQCFQVDSSVSLLGMEGSSRSWSHPEVPLSGLVRSKGLNSDVTMELLEFGLSGAESEIGI